MTDHVAERMPADYDRWRTTQPQATVSCPHCGSPVHPNEDICPTCGRDIEMQDFNAGEPYEDHWSHVTSKFHLLGAAEFDPHPTVPGGGEFNDHSFVNEMSMEQRSAHQQEVNFAVDQINKAVAQSGTGAIDDSFLDNLKNMIANQFFGGDVTEAQTIVDEAMRQSQNQDGTLDKQAPQDPAAAAQTDPSQQVQGVGQGPEPVPLANGAFAKTAGGITGHVTDMWEDIYGDKWVEITDSQGYRSGHLASEVEPTDNIHEDTRVAEVEKFLRDTEPQEFTEASVRARIANLKLARQEIRQLIANSKVSGEQKLALDEIDQEAQVELLDLTGHLPTLIPYTNQIVDTSPMAAGGSWSPTLHGVDELEVETVEPDYDSNQIAQAIPESAAIFAQEHAGDVDLEARAAKYIDKFTNGHRPEIRAHHRARFVEEVTKAASTRRSEPTPKTSSVEDDLANADGPVEALYV